jgi:PTH1 family peptidyl-tRNA hydrolase
VVIAKPLTWMNLSGEGLAPFLGSADLTPATDLLVLSDDFALPLGTFRLRAAGSSGGHNGLESVQQALGSESYPRLRVGIGPMPPGTNWADFVLSHWSPEEWDRLADVMPEMLEAVECWVDEGIEIAMSRFNRREKVGD